jgi:hypothetical protein
MDDSIYDDPAVARAGTAAFGLYSRCGVYVARHLLDGFVPSEVAAQYGTPEWTSRLLAAGLWETVPGGFHMPRYHDVDKNKTRAQVLAERQAKADRQERWLAKKRGLPARTRRRVSRPSNRPSPNTSEDGPEDAALPTSLTGSKGRARANGASAARTPPPVAQAIAAALNPRQRAP